MTGPDGLPRDVVGNFVLSTPTAQTFSLTGIISLSIIVLALMFVNSLIKLLTLYHRDRLDKGQTEGSGSTSASTPDILGKSATNIHVSEKKTGREAGDADAEGFTERRRPSSPFCAGSMTFRSPILSAASTRVDHK